MEVTVTRRVTTPSAAVCPVLDVSWALSWSCAPSDSTLRKVSLRERGRDSFLTVGVLPTATVTTPSVHQRAHSHAVNGTDQDTQVPSMGQRQRRPRAHGRVHPARAAAGPAGLLLCPPRPGGGARRQGWSTRASPAGPALGRSSRGQARARAGKGHRGDGRRSRLGTAALSSLGPVSRAHLVAWSTELPSAVAPTPLTETGCFLHFICSHMKMI